MKNLFKKISGLKNFRSQLFNLSFYLLASIISSAVSILINPFLALNLSPEDYAIIGYYTSLNVLFLPLLSFSLHTYYARKYYLVSEDMVDKIRNNILSFQMVGGIVTLLLILIIFNIYAKSVDLTLAVFPYLYLSAFTVFFMNFFRVLMIDRRISGKAKSFFKFSMINLFLTVSLALFFVVFLKYGAIGRLSGTFLAAICMGALALSSLKFKFSLDKKILKEALTFSWPILLSAILYFVFEGFDRILLERIDDSRTLGLYNVAFQITAYVGVFGTAIIQTFEPDIFKAVSEKNIKKALTYMVLITILVGFGCIIFFFLAKPVINLLTYGRYVESVPYAKVLVFRNVAIVLALVSSDIIIALGFPKVELLNRIIGSLLAFIVFYLLIEEFSFYGAAWGQIIVLLLMALISISFIFYRMFKTKNWI